MCKQLMRNASGILSSLTQLGVVFEHWLKHGLWYPATSHARYKIREAAGMTKRMLFTLCCNEKKRTPFGHFVAARIINNPLNILLVGIVVFRMCSILDQPAENWKWLSMNTTFFILFGQCHSKGIETTPSRVSYMFYMEITRMKNKGISKISNLNGIVVLPIFFSISFLVICPENVYKLVIYSAMEWILLR